MINDANASQDLHLSPALQLCASAHLHICASSAPAQSPLPPTQHLCASHLWTSGPHNTPLHLCTSAQSSLLKHICTSALCSSSTPPLHLVLLYICTIMCTMITSAEHPSALLQHHLSTIISAPLLLHLHLCIYVAATLPLLCTCSPPAIHPAMHPAMHPALHLLFTCSSAHAPLHMLCTCSAPALHLLCTLLSLYPALHPALHPAADQVLTRC